MVLKFRDAFTCAFFCAQRELVWTNDPVLKTSVMQSYIYPAIGRYLDLSLICEMPADATYFSRHIVQPLIETKRGYPHPTSAEILVEHENIYYNSMNEMINLAKYNAPLNVLITYFIGSVTAQVAWANQRFARAKVSPRPWNWVETHEIGCCDPVGAHKLCQSHLTKAEPAGQE